MTIKKPEIQLRNIKHSEFASEETHCYSATLYVDGEKWGEVGNQGHGGCDYFHPAKGRSYSDLLALNERIAATYPATEFEEMTLNENLEGLCAAAVDAWLQDRDFRRAISKRPLFLKPGEKGVYQFSLKKGVTLDRALPLLRQKYPAYRFLQDMPEAEAKAAFFASGAA